MRRKRVQYLIVLLPLLPIVALFIWPSHGRADVTDIINKKWGQKGAKFSSADSQKVADAADKFSGLTITTASSGEIKLADCAACIKKMLTKNRVCEETGKLKAGASTDGDNKAKCGPNSDMINVSKGLTAFNTPEYLAAVLAHEWCHAAQANPVGTPEFEIPCYEIEIEVLKALKAAAATEADKKVIQNRIDQMTKCVTDLTAKLSEAVIPPRTPEFGGAIIQDDDRSYGVFSSEPFLYLGSADSASTPHALIADRPFDLVVEPQLLLDGRDLVVVSGIAGDSIGTIETFAVDDSMNATALGSVMLPDVHPFSLAFNPDTERLYVLDTKSGKILTYLLDEPFDVFSFLTVYADTIVVPDLSNALHLDFQADGDGDDLLIADADLRGSDFTMDSYLGTAYLFDNNGDDLVDANVSGLLLDDLVILPGYPGPVLGGDTSIRIFGSASAAIEVHQVDPTNNNSLQLLGAGTIGAAERYVTVNLARPLVAGEFILAFDTTNFIGIPGAPLEVALTESTGIGISEILIDEPGSDLNENLEVVGTPGVSLEGYSLIVIGDGTGSGAGGAVEAIVDLDGQSIQPDGLFLMAEASFSLGGTVDFTTNLNFENSDNVTYLLVTGRNDSLNTGNGFGNGASDLDQNDDGVFDATGDWGGDGGDDGAPFVTLVDAVALLETVGSGDLVYAPTEIGPDGSSAPGHVYRCSDIAEWVIGSFSLADVTPGEANLPCVPVPTFLDLSRSPCVPNVGDSVVVDVSATNASNATLNFTVNGGPNSAIAMFVSSTSGDTTTFMGTISGQGAGALVEYTVEAFDSASTGTATSFQRGYFVGTVNIATVRVNDGSGRNIYADDPGVRSGYGVRLTGTATVASGIYSTTNTDYYIQDATGGINIFQLGVHELLVARGDSLVVEGELDQFNGKLEITRGGDCETLLVANVGTGTVPIPKFVASCNLDEDDEGQLIVIKGATLLSNPDTLLGNSSYDISNCAVAGSQDLFVDADTDIPGTAVPFNVVDVVGIASQFDFNSPFDDFYDVIPRSLADITFLSSTGIGNGGAYSVRLLQNFPNPFRQTTDIKFEVPRSKETDRLTQVSLTVFDVRGRRVAELVNDLMPSGHHTLTLDAASLGDVGNGIYFYRLEIDETVLTRKLVLLR